MLHVANGAGELPPHLDQQRTLMLVRTDAPVHTSTVEAAAAYQACGLENSFSIKRFWQDFQVEVETMSEEAVVFDLIGIDAALANAFRRILLAEVPTMAIEKVFILNNTSMIQDEVLAHRLGLIPIHVDPRAFNFRQPEDDADQDNVISFRLQVKCYSSMGSGGDAASASLSRPASAAGFSDDAGVVNARVTSGDLEWIAQGDQETRFADDPIRPVHDDILIARLRPGQEIELEAWCEKGLGKEHAKWSPVCTASYRLLPQVTVRGRLPKYPGKEPIVKSECGAGLHGLCVPIFAFDSDEDGGNDGGSGMAVQRTSRPRNCGVRQRTLCTPEWDKQVQLHRIKDHFIFSVETTGSLPPEILFKEAVTVLMKKVIGIAGLLNDAVAGISSSSVTGV